MIYILTSTQTILKADVRPQESKVDDSVAVGLLNLKLKQQLTAESFNEQEGYLETAAIAAYVSLSGLDQRQRYRASANLVSMQNETFNFTQGSSSSGLGYALAVFDAWWHLVLQKPGRFEYPIFATGEVLTSGQVNPISHLSDKIRSTCEFVNANKQEVSQFYLCYPAQNTEDISGAQRSEVTELGGILVPVDRLQSLLGTLLGNNYDGDPLGRWEPFKGLNSFNYEDSVRFFGRDKDVERLYDDLKQNIGLLIVSGASGTGKSSLIKAGLIPRLKQENKGLHWAYTTPSRTVNCNGVLGFIFEQLNIAWGIERQGIAVNELISVFNDSISGGIQLLQSCITTQSKTCLLYLDQYEEIFSQTNQADDGFTYELKIIDELASQIKSLDIVLALRSEYLGRLLDTQALSSPIVSNVTAQLPAKAWHAIVNEQAGFSGINFEQGLDDEIISEAVLTPYALPMVEFLLEQLYLKMISNDCHSNTLQLSHYKQMGGLSGAIAYRATHVIKDSQADTQIVNKLFDTFVGINSESLPYGRLVDVSQIATEEPELYKLIQHFTNANLIVSISQGTNGSLVNLAHDSLFHHWIELKQWIDDSKTYLLWRSCIDGQYLRWKASKSKIHLLKDKELLQEGQRFQRHAVINDANLSHYIKASKTNKTRRNLTLFVCFIVLPLFLVALFQWDQQRVKSYYYQSVAEKWGVPFGISEISNGQMNHLGKYYRLDYQGGLLKKMSHQNSSGSLVADETTENAAIWEYNYTEDDKLLSTTIKSHTKKKLKVKRYSFYGTSKAIVSFDRPAKNNRALGFVEYKSRFTKENIRSDISQYELNFSNEGHILKRIYQNPYGVSVPLNGSYGKGYQYSQEGQVISEHELTKEGDELIKGDGVEKIRSKYNEQSALVESIYATTNGFNIKLVREYDIWGNEVENSYYTMDGLPARHKDGYATIRVKYDDRGNAIEEACYGLEDEPALTKNGWSLVKRKYDNFGRFTENSIYGLNGERVLTKEKYSRITFKYDDQGNGIEEAYYGLDDKPVLAKYGVAKSTFKYDEEGNLIEQKFFGLNDELILQKAGYAKAKVKYGSNGAIVEQSYYGVDGKLISLSDGFAKVRMKHDVYGNNVEESYYDSNDKRVLTNYGFSKLKFKYDGKGNQTEIANYDINDKLSLNNDGIAKVTFKFDAQGNLVETARYGLHGEPVADKDNGNHKFSQTFDKNNNLIAFTEFETDGSKLVNINPGYGQPGSSTFYGADGKRVVNIEAGFSKATFVKDERGNVTEQKFYGVDDELILNPKFGYAKSLITYNFSDKQQSVQYFGIDGQLINSNEGYARVISRYDDNNRYLAQQFHYDAKGAVVYPGEKRLPKENTLEVNSHTDPPDFNSSVAGIKTQIKISSNVDGSQVFVNGQYSGVTSYNLEVEPGKYLLKIIKNGYHPYTETVAIKSGETLQLSAQLNVITPLSLTELRELAETGDAEAQKNLGNRYLSGKGVGKDHGKAMTWYIKSAEQQYAKAQYNVGLMYEQGLGVQQNISEAFNWYKLSAEQGFPLAQYKVGVMYYSGEGITKDTIEATQWFEKSAAQGQMDSQYILGSLLHSTKLTEALQLLESSAKQGNIDACGRLADMFSYGRGVDVDFDRAFYWYEKAAELGSIGTYFEIGYAYKFGYGVKYNPNEAIKWFQKSSETNAQNAAESEYQLATIYNFGTGVTVDYEKAFKWYLKSADKGNAYAATSLGNLYLEGSGTPVNYEKGIYWLRQAASTKDEYAINKLQELGVEL